MTVMPFNYVEAPASTPPQYGILSAALVVEDPDPHAGFGYEYTPEFCGPARMTPALCMTSQPKTSDDGRDLVNGEPFAVYALSNCQSVGIGDAQGRAQRSLLSGEGRAVEEWLAERLLAEADDLAVTGLDVVAALAVLEHYIHCNYGGRGTIHMTRAAGSVLLTERALDTDATRLTTRLGNPVSAGCYNAAFTGTGGHPLREQWMWATGTVMLRRGPAWSPPDPVLDSATNEQYALAERPYAGSWECFAVGVQVAAGP
jgi:hypothetical protein